MIRRWWAWASVDFERDNADLSPWFRIPLRVLLVPMLVAVQAYVLAMVGLLVYLVV